MMRHEQANWKRHVLPGEPGDDTTWFERLNAFEQQETLRQVRFKRAHWPALCDGVWSKRPTYQYPHILPVEAKAKAVYPPIWGDLFHYLKDNDIAVHTEILNLRSSQAACFNFLFPLRQNIENAAVVLRPLLPGVHRVTCIEFEYTGPGGLAWKWLGEPSSGKRGQNRTSIDAAIWWEDDTKRKRMTLVEFKYTERGVGSCGAYVTGDRNRKDSCRALNIRSPDLGVDCCLETRRGDHTNRHYWQHLGEAGISLEQLRRVTGCPFRGPFYQLMRLYLLAQFCRTDHGTLLDVDVVVLAFRDNNSLEKTPSYLRDVGRDVISAWNAILAGAPPLHAVHVEDLIPGIAAVDSQWASYLNNRYGV